MMIFDIFTLFECLALLWLCILTALVIHLICQLQRLPRGYTLLYSIHRDITGRLYVDRHGPHRNDPILITITDMG